MPALLKLSMAVSMVLLLNPFTLMADGKAFSFIVAYSYHQKTAYHSDVIEHMVKSKSLNKEEYVADVKLIRTMEDAFQAHLRDRKKINTRDLTFAAHTGYKSATIAAGRLEGEKVDLNSKGVTITAVTDFKYP